MTAGRETERTTEIGGEGKRGPGLFPSAHARNLLSPRHLVGKCRRILTSQLWLSCDVTPAWLRVSPCGDRHSQVRAGELRWRTGEESNTWLHLSDRLSLHGVFTLSGRLGAASLLLALLSLSLSLTTQAEGIPAPHPTPLSPPERVTGAAGRQEGGRQTEAVTELDS